MRIIIIFFCSFVISTVNAQFSSKINSNASVQNTPCINEGFEQLPIGPITGSVNALAISGWTIFSGPATSCNIVPTWTLGSPEIFYLTTPLFGWTPVGVIPNSPLGGNRVVQMNNITNSVVAGVATKMSQTIPVTSSNAFFNFAYVAALQDGNHGCCDNPWGMVTARDSLGTEITCLRNLIIPCPNSGFSFTLSNGYSWSNWAVRTLNLTSFIGQNITIELIATDCVYGGHSGAMLFDASCTNAPAVCSCGAPDNTTRVNWCAGSSQAVIQAPPGSQYSWQGPAPISPSQSTLSAITITNPVAMSVYTVNFVNLQGCSQMQTYTLMYSQVAQGTSSVQPTCYGASTGAATIFPTGSGTGYSYTWFNSTSSVISTASTISNVPPGNYLVQISASVGCGTVIAGVAIPNFNSGFQLIGPASVSICSGQTHSTYISTTANLGAYSFSIQPSSFLSQISFPIIGLSPTATPGSSTLITYSITGLHNASNCSLTQTLQISSGASITPIINPVSPFCSNIGSVQVISSPSVGSYFTSNNSINQYGVITSSLCNLGANTLTYVSSVAGCTAQQTANFNVLNSPTLSISGSTTICAGNTTTLLASGANSYSWVGGPSAPVFTLNPTQNTTLTLIGTDGATMCKDSVLVPIKVNAVPVLVILGLDTICTNTTANYTVTGANQYTWSTGNTNNTITISPQSSSSISVLGIDNLTSCVNSKTLSYAVVQMPTVSIVGDSIICLGESVDLTAQGASYYLWGGGSNNPQFMFLPVGNGKISLLGKSSRFCRDSIEFNYRVEECLSIESLGNEAPSIDVFPNPSTGLIYLKGSTSEIINLYDVLGKVIYFELNEEKIDLTELPNGVYFLRIRFGEQTITKRLVKFSH